MHDTHAHRRRIVKDDTLTDAQKTQILQALPKALTVRPVPSAHAGDWPALPARSGQAVWRMQSYDARALPLPSGVTTPPMITVPTDQAGCVRPVARSRTV
jgi:hypothetical protein